MSAQTPVTDIVDTIDDAVDDDGMSAEMLLNSFQNDALLPTLLVPALLVISPLSGIPLFSSLCGIAITLIAIQGVMGRSRPWIPQFLRKRCVPPDKTHSATQVLRPAAKWLDRMTRQRMQFLVHGVMRPVLYAICALAAAMIPFLELIPMSSSLVGGGVTLLGVSIMARDGIYTIAGLVILAIAFMIPWFIFAQASALLS